MDFTAAVFNAANAMPVHCRADGDGRLRISHGGKIRKQVSLSEKDDTEAITKAIRAALAENSALVRRVLHAFPYAKLYNHRVIEKAKAARVALRAEAKRAQSELHAELAAWDAELKAALRSRRKKGGRN